jgi:hypothetical protein
MYSSATKLGGVIMLSAILSGSAMAQSLGAPPSTAQIQNLQRTAVKVGVTSAAIGAGIALIGFVAHHHHHGAGGRRMKIVSVDYADPGPAAVVHPARPTAAETVPIPATAAAEVKTPAPPAALSPQMAGSVQSTGAQQNQ